MEDENDQRLVDYLEEQGNTQVQHRKSISKPLYFLRLSNERL